MTASLMERERPKSSALTIKRREGSRRAIAGRHCAGGKFEPGPQDQKEFLAAGEPRRFGAEHIEILPLQFLQQPPINGTHQFRGDHCASISGWKFEARLAVMPACLFGHAGSEFAKA